jgi:hypothetical protein
MVVWGKARPSAASFRLPCRGDDTDNPAAFAQRVTETDFSEKRLLELAVFAPQWARHIGTALKWPGLEDGVWWLHAHTKDRHWHVDREILAHWKEEISERTPLSGADLLDGAVDVAWFQKAYTSLGPQRWVRLENQAKFTSGGRGHARARLFAAAMLGEQPLDELIQRVEKKRYQDAVRALGLVPLPDGPERQENLLTRYRVLQEFLHTSRKFGAQRRTSEKLAVKIGMENLARTAGYPDPCRLEWALEAAETAELKQGPVEVEQDGIKVTLSVTSWGEPQLAVRKNGRTLKHVPRRIKKEPGIVNLLQLRAKVKKQGARMRQALEEAMVRGDEFTAQDLQGLMAHPVLAPILSQLVFVEEHAFGFPTVTGQALEDYDGNKTELAETSPLRIAHPLDLLKSGDWSQWQAACFRQERIQPFKQIFRELYLLTKAEMQNANTSQRYAGQQVNPQQALGLLGSRLWITRHDAGSSRTFHAAGITAHLNFLNTWLTPAEVDGLTLDSVVFSSRDKVGLLNLEEVPPHIFSEVMRDLDLVVSVAHRGGVDPEASASTIEMRTALVRETTRLLALDNVSFKEQWVLIEGQRGSYNVHLGSGATHIQPGGTVCIIPVHAQHRGRIFLPFADNDPQTAEVITKVLLLAKDQDLKDPTILDQLLR